MINQIKLRFLISYHSNNLNLEILVKKPTNCLVPKLKSSIFGKTAENSAQSFPGTQLTLLPNSPSPVIGIRCSMFNIFHVGG